VNPTEILVRFDRDVRASPIPPPGSRIERVDGIVRAVGDENVVLAFDLSGQDVAAAVARQAEFYQTLGRGVEWKVYGHDRPADLADHLKQAGFAAAPEESLVVLDLLEGPDVAAPREPVDVRRITSPASDASRS
jgi:hypothetical protein